MTIFVFIFAFVPAIVFPQHKSPKVNGVYEVATATYTYNDKNRMEEFTNKKDHRSVNVEFGIRIRQMKHILYWCSPMEQPELSQIIPVLKQQMNSFLNFLTMS